MSKIKISKLKQEILKNQPLTPEKILDIRRRFHCSLEEIKLNCDELKIECPLPDKTEKIKMKDFIPALIDGLPKIIAPLPEIKIPKIKKSKGDEEEMFLLLSDWQLGHKTRSFNYDVARQRVIKMVHSLLKITSIHRQSYPIKKINIFLLGDFIQNDYPWFVDLSELESVLIDQVFNNAIPLLTWTIQEIANNFEEVKIYAVRGNHGNTQSSEKDNWDDVIYRCLSLKFENNPRIKIYLTDNFYQIADVFGWKFLLAHGDQVRGGSYNIPLYALLQRMLRWATSIAGWNYMVVGHWHCYAHLEQNGQELLVNGSLVSDDEYVRRRYGWNTSTLQVVGSVHPRKGITWTYRIKL
ncbi:MAG: metallophosphoesterase [Candidatus Aenigmatarchaeota archaeon]